MWAVAKGQNLLPSVQLRGQGREKVALNARRKYEFRGRIVPQIRSLGALGGVSMNVLLGHGSSRLSSKPHHTAI